MKKIIAVSLIISILNLIGCHYYVVDKEEFINQKEKIDLKVLTQDLKVYYFDAGKYFVENDTIKGLSKKEIAYNEYDYEKVQIPLDEIKEYGIENTDQLAIWLFFSGIASILVFILILYSLTNPSPSSHGAHQ